MILAVSKIVVILFGFIVGALSLWGMVAPRRLVKFAQDIMAWNYGIHLAVAVRLLLGVALVLTAEASRFPVTFQILGWITIIAAAVIALLGRERLRRFTVWMDGFSPHMIRAWLVVGVAFGGFLIYGATAFY